MARFRSVFLFVSRFSCAHFLFEDAPTDNRVSAMTLILTLSQDDYHIKAKIYLLIYSYIQPVSAMAGVGVHEKKKPEICANQRVWDKLVKARCERVKEL